MARVAPPRPSKGLMTAYLDKLNAQQRRAVEHGGSVLAEAGPLLIIAGAGSGKTNTLAHRVAHLIVSGADPRRMLLLTFSRRAAAEMSRRVAHITASALRERGERDDGDRFPGPALFTPIGARLLREYAERIGLDRAFTIHDREDSADLMNLIRHDLGYSQTERAFPGQEHLPRDLFARRECRERRSTRCSMQLLSVVRRAGKRNCARCSRAYVEAKQRQRVLDYDDLLLYWAQMMAEPALAADVSDRFDHVLVDEYQDTNRLQAAILLALKPNGKGVTVVGDDAQSIYSFRAATVRNILDFPGQFSPRAEVDHARTQLPFDAADPRRRQCGDRTRRRAVHQEPAFGSRLRRAPVSGQRAG